MSTIHYPDDFDVDYHADWRWQREQAALKSLDVGEVLAEVDDLIAQEPDPEKHPFYSLAAHALDRTMQPGSAESLQSRLRRLIDHAIERLVEQRLSDPAWEVD
jgi:lactate dehydrogenase-like 2-hydroxyacid dehydrogenase